MTKPSRFASSPDKCSDPPLMVECRRAEITKARHPSQINTLPLAPHPTNHSLDFHD